MNIYVGNLAREVTEGNLLEAFKAFGRVEAVRIIKDKVSNEPKGFAFVDMSANADEQSAINGLNGKEFKGRMLTVNEARPRPEGRRGGGRQGGEGRS